MRLFVGLAVQPLLAAGVAFFGFPLLLDQSGRTLAGGFPADSTDAAASVAFGVGIVAVFVTVVGVFPTVLWILKRRPVTLALALLFGLAFGNLPVMLGTVLAGGYGVAGALRGLAFASLIGLTGAVGFWLIVVVWGRDVSRGGVAR
jgi:hypothetical protein